MDRQIRCTRVFESTSAPADVAIFRPGWTRVQWRSGRQIHLWVDEPSAALAADHFNSLQRDMVIDWEHASEPGHSADGTAPAAGWITGLRWDKARGLVADVKWTERAAEAIGKGEYRYYSPVFERDLATMKLVKLYSLALTNTPAMTGLEPLAASDSAECKDKGKWFFINKNLKKLKRKRAGESADGDLTMDEIMSELGLNPEDYTDAAAAIAACVDRIKEIKTTGKPADELACEIAVEAGLSDVKDRRALVERAKALSKAPTIDPAKYVTIEAAKAMSDELAALRAHEVARDTAVFIDGGMKAGKIHGSMKGMWEEAFQTDANKARKHLETAPIVAPTTGQYTGSEPKPGSKRAQVLTAAAAEYTVNPYVCGVTKQEYVQAELRAAELDPTLTAEDQKLIG